MRACLLLLPLLALALGAAARPDGEAGALARAKREAAEALVRSEAFARRAREATGEATRAHAAAAAVAARIEAAEADITAAEARLRIVEARRAEQRVRLAEQRRPVLRLAAALQTMARRPPALALLRPGSVDDIVHVRALLASTLPVIRSRTADLRAEIAAADRLRRQAGRAVAALDESRRRLGDQRRSLARIEARESARSEDLAGFALTESDRALAFTEEARDLTQLMGRRDYQARVAARLSALPSPRLRPGTKPRPPRRDAPSRYILPVAGRLVTGMGEISEAGVHARGLTFETEGNAAVVAPRGGRIAYAGPFRSYGAIIVIDHGRGWTTLIANLGLVPVQVGDAVRMGAPIGRTGQGRSRLLVELRRHGRPVPIAPLVAAD